MWEILLLPDDGGPLGKKSNREGAGGGVPGRARMPDRGKVRAKTETEARSRLGSKVRQGFRRGRRTPGNPAGSRLRSRSQYSLMMRTAGMEHWAGQRRQGPGHQHMSRDLLGPRWLLLPWLVRSCCQCQPGFRSHWRDTGRREVRRRSRCQARCLDTPACCFPGAFQSRLWPPPQAPFAAASHPHPCLYL